MNAWSPRRARRTETLRHEEHDGRDGYTPAGHEAPGGVRHEEREDCGTTLRETYATKNPARLRRCQRVHPRWVKQCGLS